MIIYNTYNTTTGVTEELPAGHKEGGKNMGKKGISLELEMRWHK